MAKPAIGTESHGEMLVLERIEVCACVLSLYSTIHEHHDHLVVVSPLPIGSCRSLYWVSADGARGGTPSDSKLGDMAPSGHFHPPCQRNYEWDYHQFLDTRSTVWNAR